MSSFIRSNDGRDACDDAVGIGPELERTGLVNFSENPEMLNINVSYLIRA